MFVENIIIGAGPSSLQLAYYFMKNNIPYIILEKNDSCASFFNKYPHSKKLISLNKKYTGKTDSDFNLRHDWNSLLNDENFLFSDYTDELYPSSHILYNYLNDFSKKFNINIQFNTFVSKIKKDDQKNYLLTLNNNENEIASCNKLIIATGISIPFYPNLITSINKEEKIIKHYADYPNNYFTQEDTLKKYQNKKILIIGGGNSSYELANILVNYCSNIIILGSNKPLSIVSHYVGDIRSIYLPFLDTFYLKSLNGIDVSKKELLDTCKIVKDDNSGKYKLLDKFNKNYYDSTQNLEDFDEIILCTGWSFDNAIFDFNVMLTINNKYPCVNYKYESVNNKNLFFIGSLMHSKDYRRGSGGFIHGFRYLIKLFTQLEYNIPLSIKNFKFAGNMECYTELSQHIYNRINNSSSIYQLYGVMCDLFYFDSDTKTIVYIEDITIESIDYLKLKNIIKFNILMLEYGERVKEIKQLGSFNKYNPSFLHPKIYIYEKINHEKNLLDRITFQEDIVADFSNINYLKKIKQVLKMCNLII